MIRYRVAIISAMLFVAAANMPAQQPAPVPPPPPVAPEPPVPPEPPEPPSPPDVVPVAPAPPVPPGVGAGVGAGLGAGVRIDPFDIDIDLGPDFSDRIRDQVNAAMDKANQAIAAANINLQTPFFQRGFNYSSSNDDRSYENGQRALDRNQWNNALRDFTAVANSGGPRADGALYWKAYALNKLGRRDEAIAAIAELRKTYAKSKWLGEASALEVQVKQAAGQPVSPDDQSDEDLKLLALNGLVNSDPDRALPILENLLKSTQSPRVKERALFVLVQTHAPQAQQFLEQMARGNVNPDLQLKAIQNLGMSASYNSNAGQVLSEVYASSSDTEVKRAVINALANNESSIKVLVDLARKETDPKIKYAIVERLSHSKSKDAEDYLLEILK